MKRESLAVSVSMAVMLYILLWGRGMGELGAMAAAIAVHELGHIMAIFALGMRLGTIRPEPGGLCIRYSGKTTPGKELVSVLAGPVAGIIYAALPETGDGFRLSADMSILYSAFNLLPVLPLDGGRALEIASKMLETDMKITILSRTFSVVIAVLGVAQAISGRGMGLLCAGIWLVIYQFDSLGLVKQEEII